MSLRAALRHLLAMSVLATVAWSGTALAQATTITIDQVQDTPSASGFNRLEAHVSGYADPCSDPCADRSYKADVQPPGSVCENSPGSTDYESLPASGGPFTETTVFSAQQGQPIELCVDVSHLDTAFGRERLDAAASILLTPSLFVAPRPPPFLRIHIHGPRALAVKRKVRLSFECSDGCSSQAHMTFLRPGRNIAAKQTVQVSLGKNGYVSHRLSKGQFADLQKNPRAWHVQLEITGSSEAGANDSQRKLFHFRVPPMHHGGGTGCTPGYSPCIPPGPDVDCAGGGGNGPRYVQGPVRVTGSDPYGLDADGDGVGCES